MWAVIIFIQTVRRSAIVPQRRPRMSAAGREKPSFHNEFLCTLRCSLLSYVLA